MIPDRANWLRVWWHCLVNIGRPQTFVFPKETHVVDHRMCETVCANGERFHFCACGYNVAGSR